MRILALFRRELDKEWRRFLVLAALSGISNAAVLGTINSAAESQHDSDAKAWALIMLVLAIVLYIFSQRALMILAAAFAEKLVDDLRAGLLEKLQSADLLEVEGLNRNEIYTCVNAEMRVISDGVPSLMIVAQSLVLVLMTMLYMASLSLVAFGMTVVFIAIGASIHLARTRQIGGQLQEVFQLGTRMMDGFTDFLEGFKEVKLNSARSRELADRVRGLSAEVAERTLTSRKLFATDFVASQVTFFLLTAMMVFVVPMLSEVDSETVVMITTSSLFLIGPISNVVGGLPVVQRVNLAADAILSLQDRLKEIGRPEAAAPARFNDFDRITLNGVTFRYSGAGDEAGFLVGPIDMEIRRGQVVFITGGNGSGKSTLLKLVTALYLPTSGVLTLDRQAIVPENVIAYRNLFSAIFSDNHLFRELYGIPEVDPGKAAELFRLLEMEHKARIVGRAFDTVALSSGQRKRLALISLILEDRPVCVFDEWAADQDPHFRMKFYREILPRLRTAGKTIIAVTHDEKYFDVADVRVHMEEGRLRAVPPQGAAGGES